MNPQKKTQTICCNYGNCRKDLEAGAMYVTACLHAFCVSHSDGAKRTHPESCLICQQPLNEADSCVQVHTDDDRSSSSRMTLIGEDIEVIKKTQKRALDFWVEQSECDKKRLQISSDALGKESEHLRKSLQIVRIKCSKYATQRREAKNEIIRQTEKKEATLKSKQEAMRKLVKILRDLEKTHRDGSPENKQGSPQTLDELQQTVNDSSISTPSGHSGTCSLMDSSNQPLHRELPHRLEQPRKEASELRQQRSHASSPTSNDNVSTSSGALSFVDSINQPLRRGFPSQRDNKQGRPHRLEQPQQMARALPQQRSHMFPLTTNNGATTSSGAFPFMNLTNQPQRRPSLREIERERPNRLEQPQQQQQPQQEASALPQQRSRVSSPTSNDGVSRSSSAFSFMDPFNQPLRRGFPNQRENERGRPQRLEQPQQMARALPQQRFHVFPLTTNGNATTSSGAFPVLNSTNQPLRRGFPNQRENERGRPHRLNPPQQVAPALPQQVSGAFFPVFRYGSHLPKPATSNSVTDSFNVTLPGAPEFRQPKFK